MDITKYLKEQAERHPSTTAQDVIKLCYQAAFGAEHLLRDPDAARAYFLREYETTPATDEPLCEFISDDAARVNFGAWKRAGMPAEWFLSLFLRGKAPRPDGAAVMAEWLEKAKTVYPAWADDMNEYLNNGMTAVHHSEAYRQAENPHYRLLCGADARAVTVLSAYALKRQNHASDAPFVISIDGDAAAGKTTLAEAISNILGGSVVHMDDFFLPPELRTPERLATPGGNVHWERFVAEVLPRLSCRAPFSYRRFDCGRMDYTDRVPVADTDVRIVEGSYCQHPAFGAYADLRVFVSASREEQRTRILRRNGAALADRFEREWIPAEKTYFARFAIRERADVIL